MSTNEEVKQEELDLTLPSSILNQENEANESPITAEDDDSDMPLPETADYGNKADENKVLLPTVKFYKLFNDCMGKLPYASILKNSANDQIKLVDLMRFVEAKTTAGLTVKEMNTIISFVATSPLEYVRPLMEIVETPNRQGELWQLKQ